MASVALSQAAGVETYEYEFRVVPTSLENTPAESTGLDLSLYSNRTRYINGNSTGTTEDVAISASKTIPWCDLYTNNKYITINTNSNENSTLSRSNYYTFVQNYSLKEIKIEVSQAAGYNFKFGQNEIAVSDSVTFNEKSIPIRNTTVIPISLDSQIKGWSASSSGNKITIQVVSRTNIAVPIENRMVYNDTPSALAVTYDTPSRVLTLNRNSSANVSCVVTFNIPGDPAEGIRKLIIN